MHDRLVVRVVELQRLRQRAVHERRRPDTDALADAEQAARPGGFIAADACLSDSPNGVSRPASASPMTSSTRYFVLSRHRRADRRSERAHPVARVVRSRTVDAHELTRNAAIHSARTRLPRKAGEG